VALFSNSWWPEYGGNAIRAASMQCSTGPDALSQAPSRGCECGLGTRL